jgi:hypothetical protein
MKLSWRAILIALLFAGLTTFIHIPLSSPSDPIASTLTTIFLLITGFIAGYVAKYKGWLHGLIASTFIYLIIIPIVLTLFFAFLKIFLHASFAGNSPFSDLSDMAPKYFETIIKASILGITGGFIGEKIHLLTTSKNK